MRNRRRTWFLRRLVLGFAVTAIAAPVAQARIDEGVALPNGSVIDQPVRPDDRAVRGVQATDEVLPVRPDDRAVRGVQATDEVLPVRADDKVLNLDPTVGAEYNQFTYRRALPLDYGVQPVQITSRPDGFDWSDAGIGAGLAFGLMLLAAGATVGMRHVGRPAFI
jgi:hypothetical protein